MTTESAFNPQVFCAAAPTGKYGLDKPYQSGGRMCATDSFVGIEYDPVVTGPNLTKVIDAAVAKITDWQPWPSEIMVRTQKPHETNGETVKLGGTRIRYEDWRRIAMLPNVSYGVSGDNADVAFRFDGGRGSVATQPDPSGTTP